SDKPDLRYGMEIVELTDLAPQTEFKVFQDTIASGGKVRGLNAKGAADKLSRKNIDDLGEFVKQFGAGGLGWVKVEGEKMAGGIEKFLPAAVQQTLRQRMNATAGDVLFFVASNEAVVCQSLGNLRTQLAAQLKLYDPAKKEFAIAWVVDFPLVIWDEE